MYMYMYISIITGIAAHDILKKTSLEAPVEWRHHPCAVIISKKYFCMKHKI